MDEPIDYRRDGHIVTITLNHPETRNAFTDLPVVDALVKAVERLNADFEARAAILTGAGSVFSSGGNVKGMADPKAGLVDPLPAKTRLNYQAGIQRVPLAFAKLEVPIIAAVNGPAIGAGTDLACMCDIRIAAESARFAESFVKVGIIPGDGGAWLLPRAVGYSKACEMAFTGEPITADEALACGLVSKVVPGVELMGAARELTARIAANPPYALRMTKYPVQHGVGQRGWRSGIVEGEWVAGLATLTEAELAANRLDWRIATREARLASDMFWTSRLPDFSKIKVPLLSSGNWGGHGLHLRGNVEGFLQAGSQQKWLDFHCLEHWTEFYTQTGIALQKRFFGHFLKDEDNGWGAEPKVVMQVRHPEQPAGRLQAHEWPLPNTQWAKMYLNPATHSLEEQPPQGGSSALSFTASSDGVTFVTAPLQKELQIIGPSAAKLWVSSSSDDADLFLILRVFSPDFREITYAGANDPHSPIAHGWLRASSRELDPNLSLTYRPYHPHDKVCPLTPGEIYELDVEIWPTCIVVPAGYRIALTVRGKDYVYPGDLSGNPGKIGQPATGVGPFRHTDPADRPPAISEATITLNFERAEGNYVLLPVIAATSGLPTNIGNVGTLA